jgi:hypothetical protein
MFWTFTVENIQRLNYRIQIVVQNSKTVLRDQQVDCQNAIIQIFFRHKQESVKTLPLSNVIRDQSHRHHVSVVTAENELGVCTLCFLNSEDRNWTAGNVAYRENIECIVNTHSPPKYITHNDILEYCRKHNVQTPSSFSAVGLSILSDNWWVK